jgi:predicted esterase
MAMRAAAAGVLGVLALAAACGGSTDSSSNNASTGGSSTGGASTGGSSTGGTAGTAGGTGGTAGAAPKLIGKCGDPVPAGATEASDPPKYSGTCPTLVAGENTISSSGNDRQFMLALPSNLPAGANLPVIFLWHWLGGSAQDFYDKGEIQTAVDTQHFIAVLPEKKGDVAFTWPATSLDTQAREDEELQFFDDMLACVSQQFSVDRNCVGSAGVSAGALWTDQLAGYRSQYLSSFISLSGGTGGIAVKPWHTPTHHLPGIVLWGGDTDACLNVLYFRDLSHDLEDHLTQEGDFFVECIHNCGHAEPPMDAPPGESAYAALWQFVLDHPFWTSAGQSPYLQNGLPSDMPAWCGIGKDSATPRTGECVNPSAC